MSGVGWAVGVEGDRNGRRACIASRRLHEQTNKPHSQQQFSETTREPETDREQHRLLLNQTRTDCHNAFALHPPTSTQPNSHGGPITAPQHRDVIGSTPSRKSIIATSQHDGRLLACWMAGWGLRAAALVQCGVIRFGLPSPAPSKGQQHRESFCWSFRSSSLLPQHLSSTKERKKQTYIQAEYCPNIPQTVIVKRKKKNSSCLQ
ncbi:hypothetical protein EDC01DRAFT_374995 [Geopyxis carbonaria]|nr:hypothetical protein EDC01DRAFT_374995 [Geopyxis carbonaria]